MTALAVSPALAPGKAAPYVIAAYVVFVAIVLIYLAIMARRLTKTERDLAQLKQEVEKAGDVELPEETPEARDAAVAARDWSHDPEIVS